MKEETMMSEAIALELTDTSYPTRSASEVPAAPAEVGLATLRSGERGVVVRLDDTDPVRLHKLLALGILPGVSISVRRRSPCFVVDVGYTQLALDSAGAGAVFVRRMAAPR